VTTSPKTVYIDTSVWIALVSFEETSTALGSWLEGTTSILATSQWTAVEVASALSIKVRRGDLTADQATEQLKALQALFASDVSLLPIASKDYEEAAKLCKDTNSGLRAGDALHLAVASRLKIDGLLTLDKNMAKNGVQLGLKMTAYKDNKI
jgi:predicted nucleic acid-binding protein